MRSRVDICFYPTDWIEKQSIQSVIFILEKNGYEVTIDEEMKTYSRVGIFLGHHSLNKPYLSEFPLIMLHDLGQAHDVWPNFWAREPWTQYYYGILPNIEWEKMYHNYPNSFRKPRHGVKVLGWPKSDEMLSAQKFKRESRCVFTEKRVFSVLYAPSWEHDCQQERFIKSIVHLPINIYIKQQFWEKEGHNERVEKMRSAAQGKWKNVIMLDSKTPIFEALRHCEVIVSDESSTMIEGAMAGCIPISVKDFTIPDTNPPRAPSVPYSYVHQLRLDDIADKIFSLMDSRVFQEERSKLFNLSDISPAFPGESSIKYAEFISNSLDCLINERRKISEFMIMWRWIFYVSERFILRVGRLLSRISRDIHRRPLAKFLR